MVHQLKREQQIACDIDTAWNFFSAPGNLSKITPPDMNFIVRSDVEGQEIFEGMIIDYYVSPMFGIKTKWQTEITQVNVKQSFTDFQKKGPYKLWNHFHEFIPNENGVLIKDTVDYELPLGPLGEIAHAVFVKDKLNHIFAYRFQVLEKMFNSSKKK